MINKLVQTNPKLIHTLNKIHKASGILDDKIRFYTLINKLNEIKIVWVKLKELLWQLTQETYFKLSTQKATSFSSYITCIAIFINNMSRCTCSEHSNQMQCMSMSYLKSHLVLHSFILNKSWPKWNFMINGVIQLLVVLS